MFGIVIGIVACFGVYCYIMDDIPNMQNFEYLIGNITANHITPLMS